MIRQNFKFEIFPKNTLASLFNVLTGPNLWSYTQSWFRKVNLPKKMKLKKDNFNIRFFWGPIVPNIDFNLNSDIKYLNINLNLKQVRNERFDWFVYPFNKKIVNLF